MSIGRRSVFVIPAWRRAGMGVWFVAALCTANSGGAAPLEIVTEDNAPFNYLEDGQIKGISTEILNEMGHRAGLTFKIQLNSWIRAYQAALNNPETCVYSTVRLPEREALFRWIGPISSNKWALFAKSDFGATVNTIEDARPYKIGGVTQDAKVLYLQSLGFGNFDLIGNDNLNLNKLIAGRVDLWITGYYKGRQLIAGAGISNIKSVFMVRDVDYYLACNLKTSDATLNALTQALHTLKSEGYIKAVSDRYANWLN